MQLTKGTSAGEGEGD
ncbi:unnamed protein product, partial [Rotaria sp. Silwood2]